MKYNNTTEFDFAFSNNTKDKTAELCLYYNLAVDRMNELITKYEGKVVDISHNDFWKDLAEKKFKTSTYLHLQVYLWKEQVSGRYATLKPEAVLLVNLFLHKLVDVRNFQSHHYHDSVVLNFPQELVDFILLKFNQVKNQLLAKNPNFAEHLQQLEDDKAEFFREDGSKGVDTYLHFNYFDKNNFIKEEGKNFFLSFFLLKGEMNSFLKKRKRCKKDNGEKYQVKTHLLTALCHRDGSNRFFLEGKADFINEEETLKRQRNSLLNYLKSQPVVDSKYFPPTQSIPLYSKAEMEERKEYSKQPKSSLPEDIENDITIRRKNKFLDFALRYLMDRKLLKNEDEGTIYWMVKKLDWDAIEKQSTMGNNPYKKEYFESEKTPSDQFIEGQFPIIIKQHAKFRLDKEGKDFVINAREIKNWLYMLLYKKVSMKDCIALLTQYGNQFEAAMMELIATEQITYSLYPLVFGNDEEANTTVLSQMHKNIIHKEKFDEATYKQNISKALQQKLNYIEAHLTEENYSKYSRNKKNKLIIEAFNWFLPTDAKLKPDDINKLSIYNYVAENKALSANARNSIIAEIRYKLQKAEHKAFALIESAQSLSSLYIEMLQKLKITIVHTQQNLPTLSLQQLHLLAAKLNVPVVGINISRTHTNRLDELKLTIAAKPVLVTNGLFKRAFEPDAKVNISTAIRKNAKWQSLLIANYYSLSSQQEFINNSDWGIKDIPANIIDLVNNHYDGFYATLAKGTNNKFDDVLQQYFAPLLPNADDATLKYIDKAIGYFRKLKEIQVQDALLAQIFFEYHNPQLPLNKREAEHVNIATLFEQEFILRHNNQPLKIAGEELKLSYKQLDDLATLWNKEKIVKLISNTHYWNDEIVAAMPDKSHQQMLLKQMNKVWQDSYHYIKTFLDAEKKTIDNYNADKKLNQILQRSKEIIAEKAKATQTNNWGKLRIEPPVILNTWMGVLTEKLIADLLQLRNNAFHADVPANNIKYEDYTERLRRKLNLPKPQAKKSYDK